MEEAERNVQISANQVEGKHPKLAVSLEKRWIEALCVWPVCVRVCAFWSRCARARVQIMQCVVE